MVGEQKPGFTGQLVWNAGWGGRGTYGRKPISLEFTRILLGTQGPDRAGQRQGRLVHKHGGSKQRERIQFNQQQRWASQDSL